MIEIKDKKDCCGCGACVQRCPKHCIAFEEDEEGFRYPHANASLCIHCGLCEKVCPVINRFEASDPLKVYAAKNTDLSKRELSSSGGLFITLAEQVIDKGGVVFGIVFDDQWEAHHVAATTKEELLSMMRSKYLQSRTENTFYETEKYLRTGRNVMYTGTPCQIAGLRHFLRKEYDNLLTVDVICHGCPSPGVWRRYLSELVSLQSARSAATGKNTVLNRSLKSLSAIADISFREKSRSGYDWQKYGFVVWQKSAPKADQNSVLSSYTFSDNPFMRGFLANIYLRPSCYACPAKGGISGADITIADYWGIENVLPDYADKSGVGLAIVHTVKGQRAFDDAGFDRVETSLDAATACNKSYWKPVAIPKCRTAFYHGFGKGQSVTDLVEQLLRVPFRQKIKLKIKKVVPSWMVEKIKGNYKFLLERIFRIMKSIRKK